MKKFFILLIGFILVSCGGDSGGGDPGPNATINVKTAEVSLAYAANATATAEFTTNVAWKATPSDTWLTVSPTDGAAGDAKITVTATNAPTTERTAHITIKSGTATKTITVSQKESRLSVNKSTVSLGATENLSQTIMIDANTTWNITVPPAQKSWCTVNPSSGTGGITNVTITATATKEEVTNLRKFVLEVISDAPKRQITVAQRYADGEARLIQQGTKSVKPVYLIFIGDGYIEDDHTLGGDFDKHMKEGIDAIFSVEPYKTYKNYFTVYTVAAYSNERGMSGDKDAIPELKNITRDTKFKSINEGTGTHMDCDKDLAFTYARKIPGITSSTGHLTVIMPVNFTTKYAGTSYPYSETGNSVSIIPVSKNYSQVRYSYANTVVHEAGGHGFGKLGDEYTTGGEETITPERIASFKTAEGRGRNKNLDLTTDPDQVKWRKYFARTEYAEVYGPTKEKVWEGGYTHKKGIWRPEETSAMGPNALYFNAPSREAIVWQIWNAMGIPEQFDFEAFVLNDIQKSMPAAQKAMSKLESIFPFIPLSEPVIMP